MGSGSSLELLKDALGLLVEVFGDGTIGALEVIQHRIINIHLQNREQGDNHLFQDLIEFIWRITVERS